MAASEKWDTPGFSTRPSTVFDIHIHAGQNSVKNISVCDDANLYRQIEEKLGVTRIHEDLQSLETWSGQSLLSSNIKHCVHMTTGTKKMDMERIYKINGKNNKEVQLEKNLGIWLDNKLTFKTHITKKPIRQTA